MFYLTMQSALYFPCINNTSPLCHKESLEHLLTKELIEEDICDTHRSVFGVYGLEMLQRSVFLESLPIFDLTIPEYKANHHRACLDLLEYNKFHILNGKLREIFSSKDQFNELFTYTERLRDSSFWNKIDKFFQTEATEEWKEFSQIKKVIRFK